MEPSRDLIDELFRCRVEAARAMWPEERLLAGPRLFDRSCRIMCDGIRDEYPHADEARVRRILAERLAPIRRLEQSPWTGRRDPTPSPSQAEEANWPAMTAPGRRTDGRVPTTEIVAVRDGTVCDSQILDRDDQRRWGCMDFFSVVTYRES